LTIVIAWLVNLWNAIRACSSLKGPSYLWSTWARTHKAIKLSHIVRFACQVLSSPIHPHTHPHTHPATHPEHY
jgi:hypothetical protein